MTTDEYLERAESLDAILCTQELYLRRYGVYEEYRGDDNLDGYVFKYSIPEHSLLSEDKAFLDDEANNISYDMRDPQYVIAVISRFITSFIFDMSELEVDRHEEDGLTDEEKESLITYMAKSVVDKIDIQIGVRWGEDWTDNDYEEGVEYYDSRVVSISSDTPEDEKELIIAMYKEEFGDEGVGIANWSDSSDV